MAATNYAFRVLAGKHIGVDPETNQERTYQPGEIVHTNQDLNRMFDQRGMPPKFGRVHQDQVSDNSARIPGESLADYRKRLLALADAEEAKEKTSAELKDAPDGPPNFDKMSLSQMKAFAEENEIDLEGAANEKQIRQVLKNACAPVTV